MKIQYRGFPDPLASDSEKNDKEYGLAWAKAVEYEWFSKTSVGEQCRYLSRKDNYQRLRMYARGEQSTDLYKKLLVGESDGNSYTNYDWRPIQVVPKFVKLIVNQMSERLYNVNAEATDKYSTDLRDKFKSNLEDMMVSKDMLRDAKDLLNVGMFSGDIDSIPESQEEIDLYMQLKYKPSIEIATEEAIKYTFALNDFDEIQSKVMEDITVLGIGAIKHKTDPVKGIVLDYADPADMVYSYPEHRDFKNVYYYGEVQRITIGELKRISGNTFTDEDLKNIAKSSSEWATYHGYSNTRAYREDDMDGMMVDVLNFTFKAQNTLTYKKKYNKNGGYKMNQKDSSFSKPDSSYKGYDVVKKPIDVWYKGSLVLGTEMLYNYGLCENMVRPKGYLNKTLPDYLMYAPELYQNRTRSLVERVIPYVDQMQQIHIKLQQLIAKARPNGVRIDVDGLSEVTLGEGNALTPLELMKIYDETGNVLSSSINAEGNYNYGKDPIVELKNGVPDGIGEMITVYNHNLNLLRDAIGIAQGADASLPHPDTLVSVQKQAALNSNTATRHVLDSVLNITERTASALTLRIKDIFKYSDLKQAYIQAIGKINVEILKSIENYHLHDFGIHIELKPDIEERQYLEANINNALSKNLIKLEDAIDIRNISSIKVANQVLKIRTSKREKEIRQHEEHMAKVNAQANAEAAQRTAQAKQMEISAKSEADIAKIERQSQADQDKILAEEAAKSRLMEQEFAYNMRLQGLQIDAQKSSDFMKEKQKTSRQDRNNTQASQMIEQRKKETSKPLTFESSEDQISGSVEMSELDPA